ncbi:MAG: fasciclin domain-containing protein [Flavobacteriales bacterium]|nr:fasciclin domain-containing protein [Flavobacteriales bacterium]
MAQCGSHAQKTSSNNWSKSHPSSIVELAVNNHDLSTLVAALQAADLVDVLNGNGPFTVFAPTNDAFNALPEGTVESLLKPENRDKLIKVLTYHVVPSRLEASDLSGKSDLASVEGSEIEIAANGKTVNVNNAIVINADNRATNGVVHIIDRVILPDGI